jgi:hypothetical protein
VGSKTFSIRLVLGALWLFLVGAGFVVILDYQNAAGSTGATPEHWPAGTRLQPARDRNTLIIFAHPQCPCTRATLEELNRVLAHAQGRAAAQVLFFKPAQFPDSWAHSDLWQSAAAIPGVDAQVDVDGRQAKLFGAETSGYVLLYDTHGQLLFRGGITGSRGHEGDNAGENAVVALVTGQPTEVKQTRVFGCSLIAETATPTTGTAQ